MSEMESLGPWITTNLNHVLSFMESQTEMKKKEENYNQ